MQKNITNQPVLLQCTALAFMQNFLGNQNKERAASGEEQFGWD